jgi:hypothetical protein
MIKDSGNRRRFDSGAVRDMQEGKGRCDLLPMAEIADYMENPVITQIADFECTGDIECLYSALDVFCICREWDKPTMVLEVAKHFEEGANKYGDNNWRKGIPVKFFIDSAIRHYLKWSRGDDDEPHDRAFCWNILCAVWTCRHKPELNEYSKGD